MKARSTYVPRLEKLEDRSIPGSLLGLADPPADVFADVLAPVKRSATSLRTEIRTGLSSPLPPAQAESQSPSTRAALPSAKAAPAPLSPPAAVASADPLSLVLSAADREAHARRIEVRTSDGSSAFAFGSWIEGCLTTEVALTPYRSVERSWPSRETDGLSALHGLTVFVLDHCREEVLLDAEGFATAASMFRIAPDHRSAAFHGTIETLHLPTGTQMDFSVTLNWTASGRPVSETTMTRDEDSLEVFHHQERPAIATGSISDGTTNYVLGPISDAAIGRVQWVDVTF